MFYYNSKSDTNVPKHMHRRLLQLVPCTLTPIILSHSITFNHSIEILILAHILALVVFQRVC
jgi:hypothetical protein